MHSLDRRDFLKTSLLAGAALSLPRTSAAAPGRGEQLTGIIDTNVNLFQWPFRRLKYADTTRLVAKLKKHRVVEAWAGSFEALLHKDMAGVNERLAGECRDKGAGLLRPFGSVNLAWPDWEEDLRRCHEVFKMPGVRIYPSYQPFDLAHADLPRLVKLTAERGLVLQVVFQMEDPRVHHPVLNLGKVDPRPLVAALKQAPETRVELLHFVGDIRGTELAQLMHETNARLDISKWESNGIVGKMIGAAPNSTAVRVPVDRVLFGSHAPYFPVESAILRLIESPLNTEQLAAIMQRNARALLPAAV